MAINPEYEAAWKEEPDAGSASVQPATTGDEFKDEWNKPELPSTLADRMAAGEGVKVAGPYGAFNGGVSDQSSNAYKALKKETEPPAAEKPSDGVGNRGKDDKITEDWKARNKAAQDAKRDKMFRDQEADRQRLLKQGR